MQRDFSAFSAALLPRGACVVKTAVSYFTGQAKYVLSGCTEHLWCFTAGKSSTLMYTAMPQINVRRSQHCNCLYRDDTASQISFILNYFMHLE